MPAEENKNMLNFKRIEKKYSGYGFSFLTLNDSISSCIESVETKFVHMSHYPDRGGMISSFLSMVMLKNTNKGAGEKYRERR